MQAVWLPRARNELMAIRAYIEAHNPGAAVAMADKIVRAAQQLEANPNMGRRGLLLETREWVVYPYIVIYRVRDDRVEILRVVHGARSRG
jgi:plasmid stabilization system protein ParE